LILVKITKLLNNVKQDLLKKLKLKRKMIVLKELLVHLVNLTAKMEFVDKIVLLLMFMLLDSED
jgi:hypothetical protein